MEKIFASMNCFSFLYIFFFKKEYKQTAEE